MNISLYETYLGWVLPGFVRNALEATVDDELQPIKIHVQNQIIDIIRDAQNQAFVDFRNTRGSPTGSQTGVAPCKSEESGNTLEKSSFLIPPKSRASVSDFSDPEDLYSSAEFDKLSDALHEACPSLSIASQTASSEDFSDTAIFSDSGIPPAFFTTNVNHPLPVNEETDVNGCSQDLLRPQIGSAMLSPIEPNSPNLIAGQSILEDYSNFGSSKPHSVSTWCPEYDMLNTEYHECSDWARD